MKKSRSSYHQPPKLFLGFFRWFCNAEYAEDIEGDLLEKFQQKIQESGSTKARNWYRIEVLNLLRKELMSPIEGAVRLNYYGMIKNHFKIAFRSLLKQRMFSILNILGLTLGLASATLIFLHVQDERLYDHSLKDADRIFKMVAHRTYPNRSEIEPWVPYSFADELPKHFPKIESATAFSGPFRDLSISFENNNGTKKTLKVPITLIADGNFFQVLQFKMIHGDPLTALDEPSGIVLTESFAKKLFGETDPINQTFGEGRRKFKVTGICEDPPINSHFKFDRVISKKSFGWFNRSSFDLKRTHCYFKLNKGVNHTEIENNLPNLLKSIMGGAIKKTYGVSWDDYLIAGNGFDYQLRPLTSIYLDPDNIGRMKAGGSRLATKVLEVSAILLILIACINFVNLCTSRSVDRAKEVGVRKVLGSHRLQLIFQFLTESFILSTLAVVLAAGLVYLLIPQYNHLLEKELALHLSGELLFWIALATLCVGLLSGLYPAFVLSSFKPLEVLKGKMKTRKGTGWFMNGLTTFQFGISLSLLIASLIISNQMRFIQNKDLGFTKEEVVVFNDVGKEYQAFINSTKSIPEVLEASGTNYVPNTGNGAATREFRLQQDDIRHTFFTPNLGDGFCETIGFELVSGSFFSDKTNDEHSILLNEQAAKILGIEDPIGKKIIMTIESGDWSYQDFQIIGIVKDYHVSSLYDKIIPVAMLSNEFYAKRANQVAVRISPTNVSQTIASIEEVWEYHYPDKAFEFNFLDEEISQRYQKVELSELLITLLTGLCIFISFIGLFALTATNSQNRAKEVSIRKVLGASSSQLLILLSKKTFLLFITANLISWPAIYWVMSQWLNDFSYRTAIEPQVFFLGSALLLGVTLVTLSFHTLKTALANPVNSLKDE